MQVTLNISSLGIRLLQVKGSEVKGWGEAPLEPGLVRDGLIQRPEEVSEVINALFQSLKIPRKNVIVSLSGLSFTSRVLSLPRMKSNLLPEAVRRGAGKEMPMPLDELYISWQVIEERNDELDIFVVGVSRNLIDAVARTMAAAGFEPYLMDLRPLALARAADRGGAIIVDLEPDGFDIVLVTGGIPAITHNISPWGEGATLEDNIQRLGDGISKLFRFYNDSHPEKSLPEDTPLLLSGELSAGANAGRLVQAETGFPVEPLVPHLQYPADFPVSLYAANAGLALKKVMPDKMAVKDGVIPLRDINLNLFADRLRAQACPVPWRHILLSLVLVIAAGLLFPLCRVNWQSKGEIAYLQDELERAGQQLQQRRLNLDEANKVESVISDITADLDSLKQEHQSLLTQTGEISSDVRLVNALLPADTCFTSVEIGPEWIEVEGRADSPFTVISYVIALEAEGRFTEVRIARIDESRNDSGDAAAPSGASVSFTIVISKSG